MSPSYRLSSSICISASIEDIYSEALRYANHVRFGIDQEKATKPFFAHWWHAHPSIIAVHDQALSLIKTIGELPQTREKLFGENLRTEILITPSKTPGFQCEVFTSLDTYVHDEMADSSTNSTSGSLGSSYVVEATQLVASSAFFSRFQQVNEPQLAEFTKILGHFPGWRIRLQSRRYDRTEIVAQFAFAPPSVNELTKKTIERLDADDASKIMQNISDIHKRTLLRIDASFCFKEFNKLHQQTLSTLQQLLTSQIQAHANRWLFTKTQPLTLELTISPMANFNLNTSIVIPFDLQSGQWVTDSPTANSSLSLPQILDVPAHCCLMVKCALDRLILMCPDTDLPKLIEALQQGCFQLAISKNNANTTSTTQPSIRAIVNFF